MSQLIKILYMGADLSVSALLCLFRSSAHPVGLFYCFLWGWNSATGRPTHGSLCFHVTNMHQNEYLTIIPWCELVSFRQNVLFFPQNRSAMHTSPCGCPLKSWSAPLCIWLAPPDILTPTPTSHSSCLNLTNATSPSQSEAQWGVSWLHQTAEQRGGHSEPGNHARNCKCNKASANENSKRTSKQNKNVFICFVSHPPHVWHNHSALLSLTANYQEHAVFILSWLFLFHDHKGIQKHEEHSKYEENNKLLCRV